MGRKWLNPLRNALSPILSPARTRIPAMDGVRGLAVSLVVVSHTARVVSGSREPRFPWPHTRNPLTVFIWEGQTGVALFFVLSGFLLALTFFEKPGSSVRRYLANRALRIYPIFLFSILVAIVIAKPAATTIAGVAPYLTFSFPFFKTGLTKLGAISTSYWAIAAAAAFYLMLPAIARAFHSRGEVIVATLASMALAAIVVLAAGMDSTVHQTIIGRLPQFMCGVLAARLFTLKTGSPLPEAGSASRSAWTSAAPGSSGRSWKATAAVIGMLAALSLLLLAQNAITPDRGAPRPWMSEMTRRTVFLYGEALIWAVIILLVALSPLSLFARVLASAPARTVGTVSFSIILWHYEILLRLQSAPWILDGFMRAIPHAGLAKAAYGFLIVGGTAFLVSVPTYLLIERPFQLLKRPEPRGAGEPAFEPPSERTAQGTPALVKLVLPTSPDEEAAPDRARTYGT